MAFNVNDFSTNISERGIAKQSHYNVLIPLGPSELQQRLRSRGFSSKDMEHLTFRAENAELPGRQITTQEHRVYGPAREYAYGVLTNDLTVTFLCSKNLREKVFFDEWQEFIGGIHPSPGRGKDSTYHVKYHDQYVSDITIEQYEETGQKTYGVKLIEAFPTSITSLTLDRSSSDLHRVAVTFHYYRWEREPWTDNVMGTALTF